MIKMMILAPRRAGMTHAEFRTYVTDVHGPLVRSVTAVAQDIRHYHYNFPAPGAVDTAFGHPLADHLDICTEASFDSVQAQKDNMKRPGYMEILRPDEHRFAGEGAVMHYTKEWPVLRGERTLEPGVLLPPPRPRALPRGVPAALARGDAGHLHRGLPPRRYRRATSRTTR